MPATSPTVALSFARSAYSFAEELARRLLGHGFHVISDNHQLGTVAATWGVPRFDLIDQTVDKDVAFCIVLLTPDFLSERWGPYRHCKLIEATQARKGFLLPVRIGDHPYRLRGVTDHLGELTVREDECDKVVLHFLEKAGPIAEIMQDSLGGHGDVETILHLYNPRLELREIDRYDDRSRRIGYELYEARETLARRSTFFLHLYRGITLSNTAEHIRKQHGAMLKGQPLIILLPKEPQQTQRNKRLENVHTAFDAYATFYIDQFIWEQCTDPGFRTPQERFYFQTFIDPHIDHGGGATALAEIEDWSRREAAPVLIIQGSGGIGKTTVAKAFANKLINRGGHKVLVVTYEQIFNYLLQHRELLGSFTVYHAYLAYVQDGGEDAFPGAALGPELFRANFDNGNVTIILDGLDEVVSRFGGAFSISALLDSIYEHPVEATHGKVIITCRTQFLTTTDIDPNVNTVELLPFNEQLATKYFEGRFPGLSNTVDRGLRIARKLMRVNRQDEFIPFVLDVVAYILHEQIEGRDPFDDPALKSDILDPHVETDYIVGKFCQREEMKYGEALAQDAQIRFFIHLAASAGCIIKPENLATSLADAAPGHKTGRIEEQAILNHPLLRADERAITFKYDLLEPYFQAMAVSQVLREAAVLTPSIVRVLANRTDPSFILDCSVRIREPGEALNLRIINLIEQVNAMETEAAGDTRRAISGLFLIALYRLRATTDTREAATELMKDLFFQNGRIYRLALRGPKDRFVFNFSGLTFEDCFFSGYDSFWECTFDRQTRFRECDLFLLHLPDGLNTTATRANFELSTCRTDDTVERVINHRAAAAGHAESIRTADLIQFLKLFYQRGHMMPQKETRLKGKYKGHTNFTVLVNHLREHGFVDVHASHKSRLMGLEYGVIDQFKNEAIKFCIEGTMSAKIKAVIKALPA
jgi:hypothetical protein